MIKELAAYERSFGAPEAIFIDFFDTIVGRSVESEYVKAIWAKRLRYRAGISIAASKIHALRVQIEAELCQRNSSQGFDDDFRYIDLTERLFDELRSELGPSWTLSLFSQCCEELELVVEKQVQHIHPQTVEFLTHVKERGVPLYLVSDTFLDTRHMWELLSWWKIDTLFTGIFLSSEQLLAKRSGRLYQRALEEVGISGEKVLMFGDNIYSDVQNATRYGIAAFHVKHPPPEKPARGRMSHQAEVGRFLGALRRPIGRAMFQELSTSLLFFTAELYRLARHDGFEDLLFCSREGLFLRQLFERYQAAAFGDQKQIRSHYYRTSRLASFVPGLKSLEVEEFETLFRQYRTFSLRSFLRNLQFTEQQIVEVAESLNCDAAVITDEFPGSELFTRLKTSALFREIYDKNRTLQHQLAVDYLASFYPNNQIPETVALVDVGWKGTIQDNVRQFIPSSTVLKGYYVGLLAPGSIAADNIKSGILLSAFPHVSPFFYAFSETTVLFEVLLSAQEPSTAGYTLSGDGVKPMLCGEVADEQLSLEIEKVQSALLREFDRALEVFTLGDQDEAEFFDYFAKLHSRVAFYPDRRELMLISSVKHFENFGLFDYTTFSRPSVLTMKRTVVNLLLFLRRPSAILRSGFWPALSLYREGLSLVLPHYARYKKMRIFGLWSATKKTV